MTQAPNPKMMSHLAWFIPRPENLQGYEMARLMRAWNREHASVGSAWKRIQKARRLQVVITQRVPLTVNMRRPGKVLFEGVIVKIGSKVELTAGSFRVRDRVMIQQPMGPAGEPPVDDEGCFVYALDEVLLVLP